MRIIGFILVLFFSSCSNIATDSVTSVTLKNLHGEDYSFQKIAQNKATVVFFLSPDCPLSQNYTLSINKITADYTSHGIELIAVVAGNYHSSEDIQTYIDDYNLAITVLLDPDKELTKTLGAKITPEVFVLSAQGDVLYSGKIDNWYITLGRNRKQITEFYLKDALTAITTGKAITVTKTDAVGCYIE